MKVAKRILATVLALLLLFGNISVLAHAATTDVISVSFDYYRQNDEGNWVKTTKIARGDTVKARLVLDSNFNHYFFFIMFAYPRSFMTHEYTQLEQDPTNADIYFLPMNSNNTLVTDNEYKINVVNESINLKEQMIDDGGGEYEPYLTESFFTENGWFSSTPELPFTPFELNADDWFAEYQFKVADDATGKGYVFVPEESIMAPGDQEAAATYVIKDESGKKTASMNEAFTWNVDVAEDSKLTLDNTVTFNAGSGKLSDGTTETTLTGYIKDAVTAPADPTPPAGMAFVGWVPSTVADPTSADVVDKTAITFDYDAVTYNALYESTDGSYTLNVYSMDVNGAYGDPVQSVIGASVGDTVYYDQSTIPAGFALDESQANVLSGTVTSDNSLALNVYLKRNTYTLTTNIDGTEATADYLYGAKVTVNDPAKTGYTFAGWQKDGTTETVDFTAYTMPAENIKVNATWTINKHTITFYADDANTVVIKSEELEFGAPVTYPADTDVPAVPGQEFIGWDIDAADMPTMPDNDVIICASYTPIEYNYFFYNEDGTSYDDGAYDDFRYYNQEIVAPDVEPTKEGYTFDGWYLDGAKVTFPVVIDSATQRDYEFTAKFVPATDTKYTVETYTMNTEGTYEMTSQEFAGATDSEVTASYTVNEGFALNDEKSVLSGTVLANGSLVLKVYLDRKSYTVSFVNEDGTAFEEGAWDNTYLYEQQIISDYVPEVPSKTGYTPIGWSIDGVNAVTFPVTVTGNIEFKPVYEIKSFNAVFNPDGGEFDDGQTASKTVSVEYGAAINAPADPTKTGYTFNGWKDHNDKAPSDYAGMPAKDLQFTAQWTANQYTITFNTDGGSEVAPITQDYGTAVTAPENPTKEGYTFAGWDTEVPATMPAGDMTITAKWTVNQYTITFADTGDSVIAPITKDYGTAITKPANPTKTGYTFSGWDIAVPATMPAGDMTITAQWTINKHTITFYADDANTVVIKSEELEFGAPVTYPADTDVPAVPGQEFIGWDIDAADMPTMPDDDVIICASYTPIEYNYFFYNEDGTSYDDGAYDDFRYYNQEIVAPDVEPTKTGYTFDGWYLDGAKVTFPVVIDSATQRDYEFTAKFVPAAGTAYTVNTYTMGVDGTYGTPVTETLYGTTGAEVDATPASVADGFTLNAEKAAERKGTIVADGSLVLNVYIDRNTYKLTTDVDGVTTDTTYFYGATVATPAEPAKDGYTFAGWDKEIPATMPAENVTVTAQWTINQYTITFNTDGGSEVAPITQDYATDVTAPANPTKEGYTFAGWDKEIPATMPAENMTITAQWTVNQYTITFNTDGGSEVAPITQDYGTAITAPENPTKTGYTFNGWDVSVPATMPAGDMTITAQWTEATDTKYVVETYTMKANGSYEKVSVDYAGKTNDTVDVTPATVAEGFTYNAAKSTATGTIAADGSLVLKVFIDRNSYKFTVNVDGSKTEATYRYGEDVVTPDDPEKTGYDFAGWSPEVPATMPANDTEVVAQWTPASGVQYKINTYMMNTDGSGYAMNSESFTGTTDEVINYTAPAVTGFTYNAEKSTATGKVAADGSLVLRIFYDRNKVSVTIDGVADDYYYGSPIEDPGDPEAPAGFEFTGWVDGDNNSVTFPFVVPAEDVVITPVYAPLSYTVTFIADGKTVATGSFEYGSAISAPSYTAPTGYTFKGWSLDGSTVLDDLGTVPVDGATFKAVLEANSYSLTFKVDGTVVKGPESVVYGSAIVTPDDPTPPEGKYFAGWVDETAGTVVPATMPAHDAVYVAKWIENNQAEYTIETYSMNTSGEYELTASVKSTDSVGKIKTAVSSTIPGFTFDADNSVMSGAIKADSSLVLKVYYARNIYTVSFDGGEPINVYYGAKIPAEDPAPQTGKEFTGWTPEIPAAMPAENLTFTSTWRNAEYTITYVVNGVETVETYTYGAAVTAPSDPVINGMTFKGWSRDIPATMPAENLIIVAQFDVAVFKVTFLDNDVNGAVLDEKLVRVGDAIPVTDKVPAKDYYTFTGWDNIPSVMPANDIVIVPVFEKITVQLIARDGSTTVIDRKGCTVDDYTDDSEWYVYGLEEYLTEDALLNRFVDVQGDGRIEVIPVDVNFGPYRGTGTIINVYDRMGSVDNTADDVLAESFRVVIFGDVNGDAIIRSVDSTIVDDEVYGFTSWSDETIPDYCDYMLFAADLDKNGIISSNDAANIRCYVSGVVEIDQVTGTIKR